MLVDAGLSLLGKKLKRDLLNYGFGNKSNKKWNKICYENNLDFRKYLLKGTTTKVTSQGRGFINFLRPLMTAGLPLKKSVMNNSTNSFFSILMIIHITNVIKQSLDAILLASGLL